MCAVGSELPSRCWFLFIPICSFSHIFLLSDFWDEYSLNILLYWLISHTCFFWVFFFFSQVHKISLYPSSVVWGSQLLQSAIKWRSLVTSTDLRGLLLPSVTLLLCLSLHPGCITEHIGVLLYTVNKNREPQLFPAPVAFSYFSWCYDHWQNAT